MLQAKVVLVSMKPSYLLVFIKENLITLLMSFGADETFTPSTMRNGQHLVSSSFFH